MEDLCNPRCVKELGAMRAITPVPDRMPTRPGRLSKWHRGRFPRLCKPSIRPLAQCDRERLVSTIEVVLTRGCAGGDRGGCGQGAQPSQYVVTKAPAPVREVGPGVRACCGTSSGKVLRQMPDWPGQRRAASTRQTVLSGTGKHPNRWATAFCQAKPNRTIIREARGNWLQSRPVVTPKASCSMRESFCRSPVTASRARRR